MSPQERIEVEQWCDARDRRPGPGPYIVDSELDYLLIEYAAKREAVLGLVLRSDAKLTYRGVPVVAVPESELPFAEELV